LSAVLAKGVRAFTGAIEGELSLRSGFVGKAARIIHPLRQEQNVKRAYPLPRVRLSSGGSTAGTSSDTSSGAQLESLKVPYHPLRPTGLPSKSSTRHGLTECSGPPHSAQRSRAESCAMVSPREIRGSQ
jgi:hypothetical protein